MSDSGWIGVDLDGTLAHYDGWRGLEHIGKPIPRMVERVQQWIAEGKEVRIFTARMTGARLISGEPVDLDLVRRVIGDWTQFHIGVRLEATNVKDYGMVELWDDRAVQVIINTGVAVVRPAGPVTP